MYLPVKLIFIYLNIDVGLKMTEILSIKLIFVHL